LKLVVVAAVAVEAEAAEASLEVGPPLAVRFAVTRHRVVNVEAIAAAFLIIAVAGKTIVVKSVATCRTIVMIGVATCKTIVATDKMIYRTLARRGAKTGRTTEMMCVMIGVTGITIVIVTELARV
jgi:hypothetical protein